MNWGVWDKTSIKGNGKHDSHLFRKQNKQLDHADIYGATPQKPTLDKPCR
jgi:hypothetical protein